MRWRDQIPYWMTTDPEFLADRPNFNPNNPVPADMDCARRILASRGVGQLFDDNLNAGDDGPGTGDPGGIYGAGPVVP